jgi:hypothetical protein
MKAIRNFGSLNIPFQRRISLNHDLLDLSQGTATYYHARCVTLFIQRLHCTFPTSHILPASDSPPAGRPVPSENQNSVQSRRNSEKRRSGCVRSLHYSDAITLPERIFGAGALLTFRATVSSPFRLHLQEFARGGLENSSGF